MVVKEMYSLHSMENIKRAKIDNDYLGDLIFANEALIRFTINKYVGNPKILLEEYSIEMDDILQIGRIAFMKAVKGFDCDRGILFTSYVPTAIARDVRHYLRDNGRDIKMPRPAHALFLSISHYLSNIQYNEINFKEVSEALGESEDAVYKAWTIGSKIYELDRQIPNEGQDSGDADVSWLNVLESSEILLEEEVIDQVYLEELLCSVKSCLTNFECEVLDKRLEGDKQSEIAKDFDVTQMQVSRIIKKVRGLLSEEINKD